MSYFSSSRGTRTDIVAFYRQFQPKPDSEGRLLQQILRWSDDKLEYVHDYIQYLFPLPEPSPVNPMAPVIDEAVWREFNLSGKIDLHKNLQAAFVRMLKFYGFSIDETRLVPKAGQNEPPTIATWAEDHQVRFGNWVRGGHNNLRITRIIRSLRTLGRPDLAAIFLSAVVSVYDEGKPYRKYYNQDSVDWWVAAYKWPLWSPPMKVKQGSVGTGLLWLKDILHEHELANSPKLPSPVVPYDRDDVSHL